MNKLDDNKIIEDEELENAKKEAGMLKTTFIITTIILIILICVFGFLMFLLNYEPPTPIYNAAKPIIYIYPDEEEMDLTVSLGYPEKVTCIYPEQNENNVWNITAKKRWNNC